MHQPDDARAQTQQAFEMVPRMWTSERFSYESDAYRVDDVPISPKPLQRPHPPLWQAAASPASFEEAGRCGVGVLGTTMWESLERAGRVIDLYQAAAGQCTDPVGAFVNDQVGFFTFVHCADTDEEEELVAAPDGGGLTGDFLRGEARNAPTEANLLIARILQGESVPDEEIFTILSAQDSLIVGSPETCRKKLRAYSELGIDRMMCLQQIGGIPHDKVLKSIRLIGELIPELS
ncbi:LLM class flavin-dependent oxidoreductase [Amycolatopsis sp. lyj-112]|uniref:LLM class flavin-dependent oxidoreductase n=1 Tax=Amycolatopsis sp. lyj-112 TaxID=2789288 RepID=UPI00397C1F38